MSYKYEDIRNFYFENELGQRIDCQKINGNLFLFNVSGLGYEESIEYVQIGNNFIPNRRKIVQNQISGDLEFYEMTYDEYCSFVNFILTAQNLKLIYVPKTSTREEYYRDIDLFKIDKLEEDEYNTLTCPILINSKSLWYKAKEITYTIEPETNEMIWDFQWDSRFTGYDVRNLIFENKGHVEAPFLLEINSAVVNPKITILDGNNNVLNELALDLTIESGEKIVYCTKDTDLKIYKETEQGQTNLFDSLDLNNTNFFKLPKGVSQVRLSGDTEITSAKLTIYVEYLAV